MVVDLVMEKASVGCELEDESPHVQHLSWLRDLRIPMWKEHHQRKTRKTGPGAPAVLVPTQELISRGTATT